MLVRITQDMQAVIRSAHLCFAAPVRPEGRPTFLRRVRSVWDLAYAEWWQLAMHSERRQRSWGSFPPVRRLARSRCAGEFFSHIR